MTHLFNKFVWKSHMQQGEIMLNLLGSSNNPQLIR